MKTDSHSEQKIFPVGVSYAPLAKALEVDCSQWESDIENIKSLGLNVFRLFIAWDRIEGVRGEFDFSKVDYAFELAERNGLRVLVNVGGAFGSLQGIYSPRWLVEECGCTLLTPEIGSKQELHSNRFQICYDDPIYQREARLFIKRAVERYKDHPALLAWSGWNEPRLCECFCEHSIALFRSWLLKKYSSLNSLAEAWSSEFPVYFKSWSDVYPQPDVGFEDGGYVPYLDWREFLAFNRQAKFNLVYEWIKEVDVDTPVISHIAVPSEADIFGNEDILGLSIYTIHRQGKNGCFSPYYFTLVQNVWRVQEGFRSHRKDPDGFWIVETEAGPVSWVHGLKPYSYSPRKMNARDMHYIAFGARSLIRWLYRSRVSDAQAGEFNLVGWNGRITERAKEFGRLAKVLNEHSELFLNHHAVCSGVMILDSIDCLQISGAEGYWGRYWSGLPYLYNAFLHIGVRAQVCNSRQIMNGILSGIKVLYIPFRPYISVEMAAELRKFVNNGGWILAESPFAIKDMRGRHFELTPGTLTDVFGAMVYDMNSLEESTCGGIPAVEFKAGIDVTTAHVDACFKDGSPAVVSNKFGKGGAVLYGSILANCYQLNKPFGIEELKVPTISYAEGQPFRNELQGRLNKAGVKSAWQLSNIDPDDSINIQIIIRTLTNQQKFVFVLNMDEKPNRFNLRLTDVADVEELCNSDGSSAVVCGTDGIDVSLKEWGWTILREK